MKDSGSCGCRKDKALGISLNAIKFAIIWLGLNQCIHHKISYFAFFKHSLKAIICFRYGHKQIIYHQLMNKFPN